MFWNTFIRLVIESYLEFCLASFYFLRIMLKMIANDDFADAVHTDYAFWWIDIISVAVAFVVVVLAPFSLGLFYCLKFESWENEDF